MENRRRAIQIKFRVNNQELQTIKMRMKECNTTNMARYLRQLALHGAIFVTDYSELKERNYELHKIGVNINQIAKKANETGNINATDMKEIKEMLDAIWQSQKFILSDEP